MIFSFEVSDALEVRIWGTDADENTQLLFFQPFHPSGNDWESKEAAEAWAEGHILKLQATAVEDSTIEDTTL